MLIISRKRYQTIHIGDDIVIKVLKTGKSTVKIGIDAPRHVRVLRSELCEQDFRAKKGDCIELDSESTVEMTVPCSDQFPQPNVA